MIVYDRYAPASKIISRMRQASTVAAFAQNIVEDREPAPWWKGQFSKPEFTIIMRIECA
jgi:hypothetical protein